MPGPGWRTRRQRLQWRQPHRLLVVSDRRVPTLGKPAAQEQERCVTMAVLHRTSRVVREQIHDILAELLTVLQFWSFTVKKFLAFILWDLVGQACDHTS